MYYIWRFGCDTWLVLKSLKSQMKTIMSNIVVEACWEDVGQFLE